MEPPAGASQLDASYTFMKIITYLAIFTFLSPLSIFLSYLWISTTKYEVNREEYEQRFSLPYGLAFIYYDYIDGGITICDNDEKIILSSGKKIGMEQIAVQQLLCYDILPREKVLVKFLDINNQIHYCSINRFHTVSYEQNVHMDNCKGLLEILRWIRFQESLLSTNYGLFTSVLLLILIGNAMLIFHLFSLLKETFFKK